MPTRSLHWVIVATLAAVGCAHESESWKLIATDHFRVYTDQRARTYEAVIERLEEVHAGLAGSFFEPTTTPPLDVFLFSQHEFQALVGPSWGGVFIGEHGKGALAIFDGWDPAFVDRVAAHELAHGFIDHTFPSVPIWFNEGFASYLESIALREDMVTFGVIASAKTQTASWGQLVPTQDLFKGGWKEFHGDWETSHYATGWAIVHYLLHGEGKRLRPRFDQFGAALASVGREPGAGATAWQQVFPEIPLRELDGRLRDHVNSVFAKSVVSRIGFKVTRPPTSDPRITPADPARLESMRVAMRKMYRAGK